jgi:hypothetical protein
MTSPNSAHTAANFTLAQDGLRDGDVITSPSLTNLIEAVHGNGIIRLQDSAYGMTSRNDTSTNSPGHCTRTAKSTFTVAGGLCVMDGVLYSFGGGPGATTTMTIDNTLAYADTTALASGQEAVYVVYICASSNSSHTNARVRIAGGSPVATSGNVYPPIPDGYLTNPNTVLGASSEKNGHALVLATIRCDYDSAGGNDNVDIIEVNDKRHFLSSSARYYTPLIRNNATTSANAVSVNRTNDSGVNNDTDLKDVFGASNDESGDFGGSISSKRIDTSAMWVSHQRWDTPAATPPSSSDADYGLGVAGGIDGGGTNTPTDVLYFSGQANSDQSSTAGGSMFTTRLTPRGVDVGTWTKGSSGSVDWPITSYGDSIFIINVATTGSTLNLKPTGTFPEGHLIDVKKSGGSGALQFNGNAVTGYEQWVYDGNGWHQLQ